MNTLAEPPSSPERGEADLLTGLQRTVSASRLTQFLQCRLKFWFRYVLQLRKPTPASLHVGNSVHAALKAWNKARWRDRPLSLKDLHNEFMHAWANPGEQPVAWEPGEEEAEKTTGWRLCDTYIRQCGALANTKPDAVEVSIEADLTAHGLPRLIGVLDLVQAGAIIDFKTSSTTPNATTVEHLHEIQTSSYALLYRHNTGKQETGLALHHLVKLKNPKLCITQLPPMREQQQTRLFRLMEVYQAELATQRFHPSPGLHCLSCQYYQECRRWH